MKRTPLLVATALLLATACGPAAEPLSPPPPLPPPVTAAPSASIAPTAAPDFRANPPPSGPELAFTPPRFVEARLSNGARLLVAARHELPLVAIKIAFDRGVAEAAPGVGSFTSSMLFQGTRTRSALAISDQVRALGAFVDAAAEHDAILVSAHCVADRFPATLTILADVVQHPAFAADEIERLRTRRLTAILEQNDQPAALLSNAALALLYPAGHPYHLPLFGDEAAVKAIGAAELRKFHRENMVPERMTVTVAGDVQQAELVAQLERAFGGWKGGAPAPSVPQRPAEASGAKVVLVDRPGLTQSSVSVTVVGPPRIGPDHDAIVLMNTLLGGYYGSRLNANLRERHAYTYGVRSSFDFRRGPGPWSASGTVVRDKTGPAIQEIFTEIRRMRDEPVSEQELSDARTRAIRRLPARFESTDETAGAMVDIAVYGLPLDEYATLADRLRKLTPADVQRAAASTLAEAGLRVVVVGDAAAVKPQLDALGLGEVVVKTLPKKSEKAASKPAAGKPAKKK